MKKPIDADPSRGIMMELIEQVTKAIPIGKSEQHVTTIITRPMWNAFLKAVNLPPNTEPTDWIGVPNTVRVYGSKTIILESKAMVAVSFPTPPEE